jgi:hypothetical protein
MVIRRANVERTRIPNRQVYGQLYIIWSATEHKKPDREPYILFDVEGIARHLDVIIFFVRLIVKYIPFAVLKAQIVMKTGRTPWSCVKLGLKGRQLQSTVGGVADCRPRLKPVF